MAYTTHYFYKTFVRKISCKHYSVAVLSKCFVFVLSWRSLLQPALLKLSQQMAEKCLLREDEVAKMKEAAEQSCDMIAACKDECVMLTNKTTSLDKQLEQTKQVCAQCLQILESREI